MDICATQWVPYSKTIYIDRLVASPLGGEAESPAAQVADVLGSN